MSEDNAITRDMMSFSEHNAIMRDMMSFSEHNAITRDMSISEQNVIKLHGRQPD